MVTHGQQLIPRGKALSGARTSASPLTDASFQETATQQVHGTDPLGLARDIPDFTVAGAGRPAVARQHALEFNSPAEYEEALRRFLPAGERSICHVTAEARGVVAEAARAFIDMRSDGPFRQRIDNSRLLSNDAIARAVPDVGDQARCNLVLAGLEGAYPCPGNEAAEMRRIVARTLNEMNQKGLLEGKDSNAALRGLLTAALLRA